MPKFRRETTKTFDKAEFMFPIKCDVHPWMSGWIAVMDNPFFAVTDEDGSFSFSGLPYGQFELVAWHEKLGTKSQTIHMLEGGVLEVDFSFSRP
jgi:hypothetical protein